MADETIEILSKDIAWQRAPGHQNLYVNNVALAATNFDIQLRLAQTSAVEGKPVHCEVATVFMSPSQAKAMAVLLVRAVGDYEDKNKITIPLPAHLEKYVQHAEKAPATKK